MKTPYIAELQAGELVTGTFLVQHKDVRSKKSGDPYLSLVLADRSGDIDAKMWDNVEKVLEIFGRDDFVKVKGLAQVHQNRLQFTVHTLARVADDEVDLTDFFPASRRDPDEMFAELEGAIAGVADAPLRGLLEGVFADEEIRRRFKRAPAAKAIHHAWLGGLLEHVLALCRLAKLVAPQYPWLNPDLLMAGVILHDIGKISELSYDRGIQYTDSGQLIGHIVIGLRIVDEKARAVPGFPPKLKELLDHMILSHHGALEFGSPKVPLCAEALLLHHLDNLDSKMEAMRGAVERDRGIEGNWSGLVASLERPVLKMSRYLGLDPETPPAPAPPRTKGEGPRNEGRNDRPMSAFGERLKDALTGD